MSHPFPVFAAFFALALGCSPSGKSSPSADDGGPSPTDAGPVPPEPVDAGPPPSFAACAQQHSGVDADGDAVIFCDAPFAARPLVRVPPDDTASPERVTMYVGLTARLRATDRDGASLVLVDASGTPLLPDGSDVYTSPPPAKGPPGLRMLSARYLFTVYEVKGAPMVLTLNGAQTEALRVDSARPYVVVTGKALDGNLLGTWEGTASQRMSDGRFDAATRVPVRLSLSTLVSNGLLGTWGTSAPPLPDGEVFSASGAIENWDSPVRGADGTCLAALSPLGEKNPFVGRGAGMRLTRFPAMHAPGDDVIVLDDGAAAPAGNVGMDGSFAPLSPAGMMRTTVPADFRALGIYPHGSPNGQHIVLTPVTGGGGGC
jgi:hypothetical protein